ncbi:MAG: YHS domain-containing protein [Planctomycetes bacterium]|nr:YHS domain-containing protein [Planctomycetota bacterium]
MRRAVVFHLSALGLASLALSAPGCYDHGESTSVSPEVAALSIGNAHPGYCQVSGEKLDQEQSSADSSLCAAYQGKRYLFCCMCCKPKFEKDPQKYLENPPRPKQDGASEDGAHEIRAHEIQGGHDH